MSCDLTRLGALLLGEPWGLPGWGCPVGPGPKLPLIWELLETPCPAGGGGGGKVLCGGPPASGNPLLLPRVGPPAGHAPFLYANYPTWSPLGRGGQPVGPPPGSVAPGPCSELGAWVPCPGVVVGSQGLGLLAKPSPLGWGGSGQTGPGGWLGCMWQERASSGGGQDPGWGQPGEGGMRGPRPEGCRDQRAAQDAAPGKRDQKEPPWLAQCQALSWFRPVLSVKARGSREGDPGNRGPAPGEGSCVPSPSVQ